MGSTNGHIMGPLTLPVTRAFAALLIAGSAGVGLIIAAEVHILRTTAPPGPARRTVTTPTATGVAPGGLTNPWEETTAAGGTTPVTAPTGLRTARRHASSHATTRAYVTVPAPVTRSSTSPVAPARTTTTSSPPLPPPPPSGGNAPVGGDGQLAGLP